MKEGKERGELWFGGQEGQKREKAGVGRRDDFVCHPKKAFESPRGKI
jgi:hypothetical protein